MDKMLKYLIWIGVIFAFFWILLVVVNQFEFFRVEIMPEGLLLTFIGILATFVVVSNYVQLKEMREDLNSSRKRLNDLDKYEYIINKMGERIAMATVFYIEEIIERKNTSTTYVYPKITNSNHVFPLYAVSVFEANGDKEPVFISKFKINIDTEEILKWNIITNEFDIEVKW